MLVVALVALTHISLAWSWALLPDFPKPEKREMLVSVTQPEPAPSEPKPEVKPPEVKPEVKPTPKPVEPQQIQPVPEAVPVAAPVEEPSPPMSVAAPPSPPDRDPDYQAAYLNKPAATLHDDGTAHGLAG